MKETTGSYRLWAEYWMETPLLKPGGASREDAAKRPGNCVKSREPRDPSQLPKHFGCLAVYDEAADRAVVISPRGEPPPRVWEGTLAQYHAMFEVD